MKKSDKILKELRRQGEELPIPKGLEPEWMQETLKEHNRKQYFRRGQLYPILAAAACLCLVGAGLLGLYGRQGMLTGGSGVSVKGQMQAGNPQETVAALTEEERDLLDLPKLSYEEIYERVSAFGEVTAGGTRIRDLENGMAVAEDAVPYKQASKQEAAADVGAYGKTNVQVASVDEADLIKNDGRYLYQTAFRQTEKSGEEESWGIQIIDTWDGLKEAAFLDGFESIEEFYVWKDLLIAIENKHYEPGPVQVDVKRAYEDVFYSANQYHEISVYDIGERTSPKKLRTFTLRGSYETSRISEGYFYGISRFTVEPAEGEQDYEAYIPTVDGKLLPADRIYCPENVEGDSYLVLVSVDLEDPSDFTDSRAVLSGGGTYYVSGKNIFMADYHSVYEIVPEKEGTLTDRTDLLRFSYQKGRFYAQASGTIPGRLDDSFSMDEADGYLRAVATVEECQAKHVQDDRTGEDLGYDYRDAETTNALYILDRFLSVTGKIEGLAQGEQIYSARFFGNTGYFVTFRQTDPLFAVDLSDPEKPTVLGELKVSGFSEYLHIYGENLLLGIGMEADEETGQQQGMKLSMFDLSDPANLKEEARMNLSEYNYSEVLYNHRAALIDSSENLIGFCAEGSNRGNYWRKYLVFSYENKAFVKKLEVDTGSGENGYCRTRGTFIGNVFYLLSEDGRVRAYDRAGGKLLEEIRM